MINKLIGKEKEWHNKKIADWSKKINFPPTSIISDNNYIRYKKK